MHDRMKDGLLSGRLVINERLRVLYQFTLFQEIIYCQCARVLLELEKLDISVLL